MLDEESEGVVLSFKEEEGLSFYSDPAVRGVKMNVQERRKKRNVKKQGS